jgi:hypothetical protein
MSSLLCKLGLPVLIVMVALMGGIALAPTDAHQITQLIHSEQITHLIHPVICAVLPAPMYEPIAECARQLAISAWSVKDLLRQGKLRAKKHGRRTIVEVASRIEYVETLPDATFAPPRDRGRNSDTAKSMTD